jgi:hypothetical protein
LNKAWGPPRSPRSPVLIALLGGGVAALALPYLLGVAPRQPTAWFRGNGSGAPRLFLRVISSLLLSHVCGLFVREHPWGHSRRGRRAQVFAEFPSPVSVEADPGRLSFPPSNLRCLPASSSICSRGNTRGRPHVNFGQCGRIGSTGLDGARCHFEPRSGMALGDRDGGPWRAVWLQDSPRARRKGSEVRPRASRVPLRGLKIPLLYCHKVM